MLKIISGGQTGADQGGLEAGRGLGLQTGGTAPLGWMTEVGPRRELLKSFGLVEAGIKGYPFRTGMNVLNSDGTVVFGDFYSSGTKFTIKCCGRAHKPLYRVCREDNPIVEKQDFLNWLEEYRIDILNVAGNRESRNSGIQGRVRVFLVKVLRGEGNETGSKEAIGG